MCPLSLSVEIEMNKTTCAEDHTCDQEQTETLPIPYSLQSENFRHRDVPKRLKNQRHNKKSYDHETDDENHAELLATWIFREWSIIPPSVLAEGDVALIESIAVDREPSGTYVLAAERLAETGPACTRRGSTGFRSRLRDLAPPVAIQSLRN